MPDETILEEAQRLVYGPRQASYGHPFDDFSKTGQMWGAILSEWRTSADADVPPSLVALCQIAVKISREVNATKRDNIVDIAGYAGTLALVRDRERTDDVTTDSMLATALKGVGLCDKIIPGQYADYFCILPARHNGWCSAV